jgi:hypothetical protein
MAVSYRSVPRHLDHRVIFISGNRMITSISILDETTVVFNVQPGYISFDLIALDI